ncbi:hypothetical protein GTP58_05670 [Duganella sp. CY15W]|uniref:hypothetical protein n=1 Tax=Duganella sp. CY15W TaxID=2692172 RepID=UPI00136B5045|nr:hypothetical protein [Duganella sp. CY15W]MYM27804.1 hypothetical protein [Duganella sp. CY15W]
MIKRRRALLCMLAGLIALPAAAADPVQQIPALLTRLRTRQDIAALNQAITLTASLPKQKAAQQRVLWRTVFSAIDAETIPGYDFSDVPELNLAPSPEVQLPAGAAPEAIKDKALREAYEQALAQNQLKAQRYRYQSALREQAERARDLMSESGQR